MKQSHVATWIVTAVGALALAASAASAASTATVTVGGAQSGTFPASLASVGNVVGQVGPLAFVCTQNSASASAGSAVTAGAGLDALGLLKGVKFATCTGPGGSIVLTSANAASKVIIDSGATAANSDDVSVHLDSLTVRFQNAICDFTVGGSLAGTFNEAVQRLRIDETGTGSTLWKVVQISADKPCAGRVKVGTVATLSGIYQLTTSKGPVYVS